MKAPNQFQINERKQFLRGVIFSINSTKINNKKTKSGEKNWILIEENKKKKKLSPIFMYSCFLKAIFRNDFE